MPPSSNYDMIPKLMITTHGKWNVPRNSANGHPKFTLPYNVRIMYATGMGVVNYLDQTLATRIDNEYRKKNGYGMRKINKFKKDLRSLDIYGCCDALACKDNRRNSNPIIKQVLEEEKEDSNSENRAYAKEFLDHTDEPYRITSKRKGVTMPLKTHEINSNEFGIDEEGYANRNYKNINDNRVILYIPGREPIDILYNWDKVNKDEPYITAKLRTQSIAITFKEILMRVKNICADLGIEITDLDIIDLSCNITTDIYGVKAPSDPLYRTEYINKLRKMVFGDDEILSSSSSSLNEGKGLFDMFMTKWMQPTVKSKSKSKSKGKTRKNPQKKPHKNRKKSRRSYVEKL